MTQIKINDREYSLAYNFQTAVSYQRLTGNNPFELQTFEGDIQLIATIGYCMLLSNNPTDQVPEFEEFVRSISDVKTTAEFINAVHKELGVFFQVRTGDDKPSEEQKEEEQKNE